MNLAFTKMHGLGNDFIVVEDFAGELQPAPDLVRRLADRRRGIGFDQLLLLQAADANDVDIRCRIFNADGGEVEQCGNGIRCVARYLRERKLCKAKRIRIQTGNPRAPGKTIIEAVPLPNGQARVNMGAPVFTAAAIPLALDELRNPVAIDLPDGQVSAVVLSIGKPHAVLTVDDTETAPVAALGPAIQRHPLFPAGVNVGFMRILDRAHIQLRVYERGAGETPACGSGACAAVAAGVISGALQHEVKVRLQGGNLQISWPGNNHPIWMTGPTASVYSGQIELAPRSVA